MKEAEEKRKASEEARLKAVAEQKAREEADALAAEALKTKQKQEIEDRRKMFEENKKKELEKKKVDAEIRAKTLLEAKEKNDQIKLKLEEQRKAASASSTKKKFISQGEALDKKIYEQKVSDTLAAKYPEGVTTEIFEEGNKKVHRVIVVRNGKGAEYKKIVYNWGTFYKKNNIDITEVTFKKETKVN
jgi:hypothetical protein